MSKARATTFLLFLASVISCSGGGDGSSPTSPSSPQPTELSPNPQTWTQQSGDVTLPNGPGFHPTKTLRVGNVLRTYYVFPADGHIGFAESVDGQTFTRTTATNIQRVNTPGDLNTGLDHPSVIRRADGKFLMVYDYSTDPTTNFARRLATRVSDDGITFGDAVLIPTSAMDNSPGSGKAFEGVTGLVLRPDGSIRAYYTSGGGSIGSALTTDGGATWTEDAGERFGFDGKGYLDVDAITDTDGSVLLYFGFTTDFGCTGGAGTPTGCFQIRMARSTDGLNFKIYAGNVLAPGNGTGQYQDPDVFIGIDGTWRMLFGDASSGGNKLRMAVRQ